jgi:hypothetical protein
MSSKYNFYDSENGVRVQEHDHTVKLEAAGHTHLTPAEASKVASALILAATAIEDRKIASRGPALDEGTTLATYLALDVILLGIVVVLFFSTTSVHAQGACGAIRDYEDRQACIAVQDGNSAECASLKNSDARTLCRIKSENRRSLRDSRTLPSRSQ